MFLLSLPRTASDRLVTAQRLLSGFKAAFFHFSISYWGLTAVKVKERSEEVSENLLPQVSPLSLVAVLHIQTDL